MGPARVTPRSQLIFLCLLPGLLSGAHPPAPRRLVVLLVIDQLRPDYLERYRAQWTGGFARILREAAYFPRGMQDHALTETAPGHATLLSGRYPGHVGIVSNNRGVLDPAFPVLGAQGEPGASPLRFRGTTLYDWMRAADPGARLLAVSKKDRGAMLPVGRARGPVFWYVDGRFTTSRYYADSLPTWVTAYNARQGAQHLAGKAWTLLLDDSAYQEADSMPFENNGRDVAFPHRMATDPDSAAHRLPRYPWMDSLTLDFAEDGAGWLGLGRRNRPDLLVISLSTTDYVGHEFGPDSREMHDHLLRLDRWLGAFFDSLTTLVPWDQTLLVLTADHGVVAFPELARARGRQAGRVSLQALLRSAVASLQTRYGETFSFEFDAGLLSADLGRLRARGVRVDSLAQALAVAAKTQPGVIRTYTAKSLAAAPSTDMHAARWRRSLPADYGWLFCAALEPGYIWASASGETTHGTTNPDDVDVPIAFLGGGIHPGVYRRPIPTVDIAPTLAALLQLTPAEPLDGRVLPEVSGRR
ncbi:MAG: alkaline phosphatase family protein [Gemmatimonadales bacterium]